MKTSDDNLYKELGNIKSIGFHSPLGIKYKIC